MPDMQMLQNFSTRVMECKGTRVTEKASFLAIFYVFLFKYDTIMLKYP